MRMFVVGADQLAVRAIENGQVGVRLEGLGQALQLAADIEVVLALRPDEARQLAASLSNMADEAEASQSARN